MGSGAPSGVVPSAAGRAVLALATLPGRTRVTEVGLAELVADGHAVYSNAAGEPALHVPCATLRAGTAPVLADLAAFATQRLGLDHPRPLADIARDATRLREAARDAVGIPERDRLVAAGLLTFTPRRRWRLTSIDTWTPTAAGTAALEEWPADPDGVVLTALAAAFTAVRPPSGPEVGMIAPTG
jgi:hypothetical protein